MTWQSEPGSLFVTQSDAHATNDRSELLNVLDSVTMNWSDLIVPRWNIDVKMEPEVVQALKWRMTTRTRVAEALGSIMAQIQ